MKNKAKPTCDHTKGYCSIHNYEPEEAMKTKTSKHTPDQKSVLVGHKSSCGCHFTYDKNCELFKQWTIKYCSTHAAAPELLEALKHGVMVIENFHPENSDDTWVREARAVIAKVEGR